MDITGRKLFVKALEEEGVDTIFAYPGGTVTDLFDELYKTNSINLVLPRHEQGLIHEAEGYAKSTGKVGVCLVTSGPGATNTVTGIATAYMDSIPLVVITGQVPTDALGSDAFFPFGDNVERARKSGVCYIAEPGGSIRDDNVIATADKYGMVLVFTGARLFHH